MNLSAEHVSVLRGRTEIVHDVSFSVSDGQWLMICGPNGAGKSTLLSAVSQELPYTGLVTLDGTDLRRMKPRPLARRMAMLRQLSDLAYAYTVEEVVAMGRYAHRGLLQADSGGAEAVERALQAVQLQDKRRQNILTLSGGDRQRMLQPRRRGRHPPTHPPKSPVAAAALVTVGQSPIDRSRRELGELQDDADRPRKPRGTAVR